MVDRAAKGNAKCTSDTASRSIAKHGRAQFARFLAELQPWGTPDEVIEQTRDIVRRTGAGGLIVVSGYGNLTNDVAAANQERFARAVMPALYESLASPI